LTSVEICRIVLISNLCQWQTRTMNEASDGVPKRRSNGKPPPPVKCLSLNPPEDTLLARELLSHISLSRAINTSGPTFSGVEEVTEQ
jgi:hypothetical protein